MVPYDHYEMTNFVLQHALVIYELVFWGALILVATWEALTPRRALKVSIRTRWGGNVGVMAISALLVKTFVPITGFGLAYLLQDRGWGLLNMVTLPAWLAFVAAILLLDFARYAEHVLMHKVPLLWRIHRLHHTDQDVDFTTQFRAHPLEVLIGGLLGLCGLALIGPPVLALVLFEICFAAQAFWVHSNVAVPTRLESVLRRVFSTPDVHRVHHSIDLVESNSNFGAMLTWWDRLFGTFVEQPALGHRDMVLGIAECQDPRHQRLAWMLLNPFTQRLRQPQGDSVLPQEN
jgi:sterol desaturase/sphingolipid hydroxylase (fatty acid hydroxylase superfamily)